MYNKRLMINSTNLDKQISKQLPAELVSFMAQAGEIADKLGQKVYLVGGVVRDLLLKRPNQDLDLVAEGDAIKLAEALAKLRNGEVIAHSRFNTAKIRWDKWNVDIATTRAEIYEKPGALPTVKCGGDIEGDLIRRDFTINAMAVDLDPQHYGEIIDLFKGGEDLEKGLIRILHDDSFKDDATRIWRAVRYEQRLEFRIEPHTLDLLKQDIAYLDSISGDRIRHELELCLEEEYPEKVLLRANKLGLLGRICASLKADEWAAKNISRSRGIMQPYCPPEDLYLAFLVYRMTPADLEDLVTYLKFPRALTRVLRDTLNLRDKVQELGATELPPSSIYRLLHSYNLTAVLANLLAADSQSVKKRIENYLNHMRSVKPALSGDEITELGFKSGPRIKELLELLMEARLDGKVSTRDEEIEMMEKLSKAEK